VKVHEFCMLSLMKWRVANMVLDVFGCHKVGKHVGRCPHDGRLLARLCLLRFHGPWGE
jgi:hypothetical protein